MSPVPAMYNDTRAQAEYRLSLNFLLHKRLCTAVPLEPVGEFDRASSGPFSAWLHPAASTIEQTSPASPPLPGEKIARSRAEGRGSRKGLVLVYSTVIEIRD